MKPLQPTLLQPDAFGQTHFSLCRAYRYTLYRVWAPGDRLAMFVGLNPSTADETVNDNTMRRCINFAKDWGYDGLIMTNLFAYRATDPRVMKAQADPVGPENDHWLLQCGRSASVVVAAWGNHGSYKKRDKIFLKLFMEAGITLKCLFVTRRGQPQHPLFMPGGVRLRDYP